jgi:hypothetical protein
MTLFEILSKNERVIVWSNEETGYLYTWNQSITLQVWHLTVNQDHRRVNSYEEVSIRTLGHDPRDFKGAREAAKRWDVDGVNNDR